MGETKQPPEADDAAADIEREIRRGRKFSLNEALGRLGGEGMLKGASPVPPIGQTEAAVVSNRIGESEHHALRGSVHSGCCGRGQAA